MNDSTLQAGMFSPAPPKASCSRCAAQELCLPSTSDARDIVLVDGLIGYRRRLGRDEVLFRKGQAFAMIYAVRFGHLKSSRPDHRGSPHVTGFYMAGDLMGLDAICTGLHACTTIALEDSEVCEIPYARLQQAMHDSLPLMQRFQCALSHEIVREQEVLLHSDMNGAERMASLLLDLSTRYAERGYSGRRFRLRMSRGDMGNYLGLTIETVSRLLGRFRDEGWIALDKRDIELLHREQLESLITEANDRPVIAHANE
jgi:CRP/FNR family transcriptional regulator, anaerobic regulatory protein